MHPNQAAVAHRATVHNGTVPDGHPAAHHHIQPRAGVQHRIVLHVGALPNDNVPGIGPQHRAIPDAAILFQQHTARQRGIFGHKGRTEISRGMGSHPDIRHTAHTPFALLLLYKIKAELQTPCRIWYNNSVIAKEFVLWQLR